MTFIPTDTYLRVLNAERDEEARQAAFARAARLARRCCEASASLVDRIFRAFGLREAAVFSHPASCEE